MGGKIGFLTRKRNRFIISDSGKLMAKRKDLPLENWLTSQQAADAMGITARHVLNLCKSGDLECKRIAPRLWLVNPQSVSEWTPKQKRKSKSEQA
jgi:hypothetical protein